jgi:hypothetical protein
MKQHKSETGAPLMIDCIVLCPHLDFDDYFFGLLLCVGAKHSNGSVSSNKTELKITTRTPLNSV